MFSLRGAIVGAIGGGAVAAGVARTAKKVDDVAKAAKRLGVGVGFLSRFGFAAELAGSDLSQLERGIKNLNRATGEAADGTAEYDDAIKRLGLDTAELNALDPATRFLAVATALGKLENEATQTAIAQNLLGRSGFDLIPLMEEIAKNFDATATAADKAGAVINDDLAVKAEKLADQMLVVNEQMERFYRILLDIATDPAIKENLDRILKIIEDLINRRGVLGQLITASEKINELRTIPRDAALSLFSGGDGADPEVKKAIIETAAATKQVAQQQTGTFRQ